MEESRTIIGTKGSEGTTDGSGDTSLTRRRYDRVAPVWDMMDWAMERAAMRRWRRLLWAQVEGERVLEVGVGTGANFSFYAPGTDITGIDLSPRMLARAQSRADRMGLSVDLRLMDVETLDFPDDSFDAFATSCVFCSVPHPLAGFRELHRVLRPEGHGYLLEHVLSQRRLLGTSMRVANPLVVRMWGPTSIASPGPRSSRPASP